MDTGRHRVHRLCVTVDVHYLESVGVPAATVVAADAAFSQAHMPQAGRGGAVVTGGHERVEAARLGWFHVHAQGGLTELVTGDARSPGDAGATWFNQVLSGLVGLV